MPQVQWSADPVTVQLQELRRKYRHLEKENDELRDRVHVTHDTLRNTEFTLVGSWLFFVGSWLLYFLF